MTKHEINTMDWVLLAPAMLILNQYFDIFVEEYYVLWAALVCVDYIVLEKVLTRLPD